MRSALSILLVCAACRAGEAPPYAPKDALDTFEIEQGFRIELVASEPLVMDPVAMDIDEHGRIYVVEMPGYPLDTGGSGRVKLLRDTDGDGRPDEASLFASGLRLPTGVMRWKRGVLVTDPPDILYLEDSDGDGRADISRIVLTGFALSNPQHNANKPLYGLDNWIYIANNGTIRSQDYADTFGDRGAEIHFPENPGAVRLPRNGSDRNIRFRPETFAPEALSSKSQFGQTFDAWGNHFLVDNSHHHYHEVIAARNFERNPLAVIARATHSTSDHGDAAEVFAITVRPEHQLLTDQGVFTSACAITFYLGGLFPAPYDQDVSFTAEPVHNPVHADKVTSDGPAFRASRMGERREFLASTDSWFRPVNFTVGPDGALYVVDYYRQIVEHSEWMDHSIVEAGRLTRGSDRGHIYRIAPHSAGPLDWHDALALGREGTEALVARLAQSNAWWRLHAQRLLVDQKDPLATGLLAQLFRDSAMPEARLHALWTLDGLEDLEGDLLRAALRDKHPGVRKSAVRLAERHLGGALELAPDVLSLVDHPDAGVRFQLLNTLGFLEGEAAIDARRRLLGRGIDHPWVQTAALLAQPDRPEELLPRSAQHTRAHVTFRERIAANITARDDAGAIQSLLEREAHPPWRRAAALRGVAEGLRQSGAVSLAMPSLLDWVLDAREEDVAEAAIAVLEHVGLPRGDSALAAATAIATDQGADAGAREWALRVLALGPSPASVFAGMIHPGEPIAVQRAALRALGQREGALPAERILEAWPTLTPILRKEALDFFRSKERAEIVVQALESGAILPVDVSWPQRVRLIRDTPEPIRSRARRLLRLNAAADPGRQYERTLGMDGDFVRGKGGVP